MKYIQEEVKIAWLEPCFYPMLVALERTSPERQWTIDDLRALSRKSNSAGLIAVIGKDVVGYVAYDLESVEHSIRIENLVVSPDYRRKGVGTYLVQAMLQKHPLYTEVDACVRESNFAAHMFYKRNGFLAVGVLRKCWPVGEEYEDGYEFVLRKEEDHGKTVSREARE